MPNENSANFEEKVQAEPQTESSENGNVQAEPSKQETDWVQEARKWEKRAKENKAKADELDKLKEAQMSETEKLQKKLAEVTEKAKALEREKERAGWISEVSKETGLSLAQLEAINADSKEALLEAAKLFEVIEKQQGGIPVIANDGTHAQHEPTKTAEDWIRSTVPNH